MTRRQLVMVLAVLALVTGVASFAIGVVARQDPVSGRPGPIDGSPAQPERPYARDVPMLQMSRELPLTRASFAGSGWRYTYPRGWLSTVEGSSLRYRPPGAPDIGGYSLRVRLVDENLSTQATVAYRHDRVLSEEQGVTFLGRSDDTLRFVFRDEYNHRRYNFLKWIPDPDTGFAAVELSVVGRKRDLDGLNDLFAKLTADNRQLEDRASGEPAAAYAR